MSTDRLAPFLDARSIAIFGASSDPNKLTGRTLLFLSAQQFAGEVYPINDKREAIAGYRCYRNVAAIGRPVDMALIFTPAENALAAIEEGRQTGIRSFIVFASGFAEAGGDGVGRQDELAAYARRHGVSILGPNCVGVINSRTRLMATFSGVGENLHIIPGGFSFASQSGALAAYWLDMITSNGIGFAKWISTGNEADLTMADAIRHLAADAETRAIGLYLEGVRDGAALRDALAFAAQSGKPILAIKTGATAAGAIATLSHTGAVSGADDVWDAVFERYGVVRCRSLHEMNAAAKLALFQPGARARRPAMMSVSGGAGAMLVDAAAGAGIAITDFSPATKAKLGAVLPPFAAAQNPVDVTGAASPRPEIFSGSLKVLLEDPDHDSVVVFLHLTRGTVADNFVGALLSAPRPPDKALLVISLNTLRELRDRLEGVGIPVFDDIPEAVHALRVADALHLRREAPHEDPGYAVVPRRAASTREVVPEHAVPAWVGADWPFAWPRQALARSAADTRAALGALAFPLVAKLQSAAMPHKTEQGGIVLGLRDAPAAEGAVVRLLARATDLAIPCDGILLQEMLRFEHELLVGLRADPVFGPILVVGRGGIDVEADPDVAIVLLPAGPRAVEAALRRLRCARVLERGRGRTPVDLAALANGIARLARWYAARPEVLEIELNPVAVGPQCGTAALDALIVTG